MSVYGYTGTLCASRQERMARPGRRMWRVCTGTLVHCVQAGRERVARPGKRLWRVYMGTLVRYVQAVRGRGARPGQGGGGRECIWVRRYAMCKQAGTNGQAREEDEASVYRYTGTLCASGEVAPIGPGPPGPRPPGPRLAAAAG